MHLSPLQSRLAASVIATVLLIILYFSLFNPQFAFAQELSHEPGIVFDDAFILDQLDDDGIGARDRMYEPEFQAFDRSIIGRAADVTSLVNNVPIPMNANAGDVYVFTFDSSQISSRQEKMAPLELREENEEPQEGEAAGDLVERAAVLSTARTVYISANTCLQPQANSTTDMDPPQLTMYVSTSSDNTSPGPAATGSQDVVEFTEGAVMFNVSTSDDVYIAVAANNVSDVFSGIYNFQVAASVDGWYHSYDESVNADLIWVDSDIHSVLLMTRNLTQSTDEAVDQEIMGTSPYVMFAQNDEDRSISGLRYSYCGLNNKAQIAAVRNGQATSQVTTGITRRGAGNLPKQQFYFSGLNASTQYQGILASNANATTNVNVVGGGGHVYRATNFTTKSNGGNCAVVFNLTFCDQVAYAVPSNNITYPNVTLLGQFYDDYAKSLYDGFNKSLQQIQCEAPNSQLYSLVRNCSTCAAAYKTWLCSVTIPRCEDFTSNDTWLQPRALNQTFPDGTPLSQELLAPYAADMSNSAFLSSRNPLIDSQVKPGPYKEILPCQELCYDLVQSCPAQLGFACPRPWLTGFNTSYGVKPPIDNGSVVCNYPGAAHTYSASSVTAVPWILLSTSMAFALM